MMFVLMLAPLAPAASLNVRLPYEGPAPFVYQGPHECDAPLAVGIVCLEMPKGAHSARFLVEDVTGRAVGGSWHVHDENGAELASGGHCGSGEVAVPTTGGLVVVRVEALRGPIECAGAGEGPAAVGT